MLIACWSTKGGAGTTVVAAALGLLLARRHPAGALVVDLAGDVPAALGLPPTRSGPDGSAPDLDVGPLALAVRPLGAGTTALADLRHERRAVVVDCGRVDDDIDPSSPAVELLTAADRSLLVLRPCYLALRRASATPHRPSGVVLVVEPGRAITADDVADSLGVPVVAEVPVSEAVARAVDAGLLATRLPRSLLRELGSVA